MHKRQAFELLLGTAAMFSLDMWARQVTTPASTTTMIGSASFTPIEQTADRSINPEKVSHRRQHRAEKMFLAGVKAIEKNDPRTAEKDFLQAHELDPNHQRYSLSAEIARQYTVMQLIHQAKEERRLGHKDQSLMAIEEAVRLDPQNPIAAGFILTLVADASKQLPMEHTASIEAAAPVELMPQKERHTFHLRADEQDLIRQVLHAYGIQATLDASVKNQRAHFDTDDVDFEQAVNLVKLATNTFFVPLDSLHLIVAADTEENRNKYQRQVTETIYFPGLNITELTDMGNIARNIFGATHSVVHADHNTMTIRAPEPELTAMNEIYTELLVGRSELQLEVRLYEIDKTKAINVGVILPSSATVFNVPSEINNIIANNSSLIDQIISSGLASAGDYAAIIAALIASGALTGTVFNNPFAVFGGGLTLTGMEWNSRSANMLLNSSDVRSLDQVQLRVLDQEEATIRSGERYPIMTSSFSNLASSSSTSTIPQIQYEDLGLTLKVKPHIGRENEVSLNLELKVSSLAGSTINNIPVLNNRQYTGVVSLYSGDSALVVSAISKRDLLEITGFPGLNDIPGFQNGTNRQDATDSMELVILITPHVIRLAHKEAAGPKLLLPQH